MADFKKIFFSLRAYFVSLLTEKNPPFWNFQKNLVLIGVKEPLILRVKIVGAFPMYKKDACWWREFGNCKNGCDFAFLLSGGVFIQNAQIGFAGYTDTPPWQFGALVVGGAEMWGTSGRRGGNLGRKSRLGGNWGR